MSQNTDTVNQEHTAHSGQALAPTPVQIREALARLREVGETLSLIDAVALVRQSRDLSVQESRL